MTSAGLFQRAAELRGRGEAFVLATVVWRRGPSSGKQGYKALIFPDGGVEGWLGGACAEPTVVRESKQALADGRPRLMFLGPADELDGRLREGVVSVPMACESEGALEVYLEPVLPPPHVVVIGRSPAVAALASLARELGWRATIVDDGGRPTGHPEGIAVRTSLDLAGLDLGAGTAVVVATQGHYDEEAIAAALGTGTGYVGLVASRRRAAAVLGFLRDRGVPDDALQRVRAPAGLDLGEVEHHEVAVAILAELVRLRAAGRLSAGVPPRIQEMVLDPVCGMEVELGTARHRCTHGAREYFFCAAGCQQAFEADPAKYAI